MGGKEAVEVVAVTDSEVVNQGKGVWVSTRWEPRRRSGQKAEAAEEMVAKAGMGALVAVGPPWGLSWWVTRLSCSRALSRSVSQEWEGLPPAVPMRPMV